MSTETGHPEGLTRTGRPFGGLVEDARRRARWYSSDWRDGLSPKVAASVLFLFFACVAPAVAFGGLMSTLTGGAMGAIEMLVSTAVCGVAYALLSGQPLTILGGTGPLLVFTGLLYQMCERLHLPFLPTYACIGLWTIAFLLVLVATDASALIRYFTRFTDETFAALISLIFIVQAVTNVAGYFPDRRVPDDTALFSVLLTVLTYLLASRLARMRQSPFLRGWVRELLADFGPALAVVLVSLVPMLLPTVNVPALDVPSSFSTTAGRPWLVDPRAAPRWVWAASALPALVVTLLVYLDQNITARLVNSREHALRKGPGYHLDLAVVAVLIGASSLFGLPWLVGATVRSLNHVRSLATVDYEQTPGGVPRPRVVSVLENRASPLLIHLAVGASLLLTPLLRRVPMPVLFGLFLYMGVASMRGNQFFERLRLWVMDPELYPPSYYLRRVPARAVHGFTAIQLVCLAVLWVVKTSAVGILFPVFIGLLVPTRRLLERWFDPAQLALLDAEAEPDEGAERVAE